MSCAPLAASPSVLAPARAGELTLSSPIACAALHATVPAACCLLRQVVSARHGTRDVHRGQGGSPFPSCTAACAEGAAVRRAVTEQVTWRGAGPGGRFDRGRSRAAQWVARRRLELVGALEPVPSVDEPPGEAGEDEGSA